MLSGDRPEPAGDCPSREALAAYAAGKLPSPVLVIVASHIAACPDCQSSLEIFHDETPDSDSLIGKLRRCVAMPPLESTPDDAKSTVAQTLDNEVPLTLLAAATANDSSEPEGLPSGAFGQYELLEEIGHGAMGVVYKARQTRLNRLVALKMIRSGVYAAAGERQRFCIEGEAVARLQHPHVIQVHEFNEHAGQLYLCMEFLEGGTLADKITGNGLPVREGAVLVRTLAEAVHVAHERHIVHRDLKPGNVLLTAEGTPKIGDFGLARLMDMDGAQTAPDAILGTPSYMAPEQAEGRVSEVGSLADVYALGAILYHALTGQPPFRGATRMATLDQVRTEAPVPPTRWRREIPRDLEAVCLKCLAKQPVQRYASAEALAQDLDRWLRGEPTVARPRPWYARAWQRTPRRAAITILVILGAIVAFLLYLRIAAPDPDRAVQDIEYHLAKGESVTVIGENGGPPWSRWLTGAGASQVSLSADNSFTLHSWGLALLELVRDTQTDCYLIHLEVRHERTDTDGEVGLFFALTEYPVGQDTAYYFIRLGYNDLEDKIENFKKSDAAQKGQPPPPVPNGNAINLGPRLYAERKSEPLCDVNFGGLSPELFKAAGFGGVRWRSLTVEVTPTSIRGVWENKDAIGELSATRFMEDTASTLTRMRKRKPQDVLLNGVQPGFRPQGALGLYVLKGTASFRRVVIEPAGGGH